MHFNSLDKIVSMHIHVLGCMCLDVVTCVAKYLYTNMEIYVYDSICVDSIIVFSLQTK